MSGGVRAYFMTGGGEGTESINITMECRNTHSGSDQEDR